MKRKGETFAEFLTAATVFGIIAASMFEFMANQTQTLANIRNRDNLMYLAQRVYDWTIEGDVNGTSGTITVHNHKILHNIDHNITAGFDATYFYRNRNTGGDPEFAIENINSPIRGIEHNIVSFDWDKDKNILTVKNNNASMQFTLKP